MKIAFVSRQSIYDIHAWSGSVYSISKALKKKDIELYFIDNLDEKRNRIMIKLERLYAKITRKLFKKEHYYGVFPITLKYLSCLIKKQLTKDTDIIFGITSEVIAYLKTEIPKILFADSVFAGKFEYYKSCTNLSNRIKKYLNTLEKNALDNCDKALFTSDWAKDGAIKYYNCDPDKIKVVPFGANIECNRKIIDIEKIIENKKENECNLLFIGVEWERKGAAIALETADVLHNKGINVHLDIVGIRSCPVELPDYVTNHGFISKSTEVGNELLDNLFKRSHFFILPTRAECFGVVWSEASSFGLPSLATNTGGVPTAVFDGLNGKLFELSDRGEVYAKYIQTMLSDFNEYKKLCFSSFVEYEKRLNWNTISDNIICLMRTILL
ncbi:MAG: glycosyltransferase family 4 protein [Treponema sp.]|nr:glycosyltransferase family 4 protein [Treponema sp.]